MRSFDKKFGTHFITALPASPGIYRIFDGAEVLIYVGKAKNLRRRISQYRNAKRRKKHLKMRAIIGDATRIDFESCPTHLEACLLETRLIQEHRPRWNVAGAFSFLYPMIGMLTDAKGTYFCYTTQPDLFPAFQFHGAFRSRDRTGEAFFALIELLEFIGHRMSKIERREKYSYVYGFRQLPRSWVDLLESFWKGQSRDAIEELVLALVENAGARRKKRDIQELLNHLGHFWKHEAMPLARARDSAAYHEYPVPQKERDLIFLKHRLR